MKKIISLAIGIIGITIITNSAYATSVNKYTIMDQGNIDGSKFTWNDIVVDRPNSVNKSEGPDHIVIMDRNLGAQHNDYNDFNGVKQYGYTYQWGNNYGFPSHCDNGYCEDLIKKTEILAACDKDYSHNGYVRKEFYSGDHQGILHECYYNGNHHNDMWGGENDSGNNRWGLDNYESTVTYRQGPCPNGYHVPSIGERKLLNKYRAINNQVEYDQSTNVILINNGLYYKLGAELKIPRAGYRKIGGELEGLGEYGKFRSSTPMGITETGQNDGKKASSMLIYTDYENYLLLSSPYNTNYRSEGLSVRCFKDYYNQCEDPRIIETCNSDLSGCPTECKINSCNNEFIQSYCADGYGNCPLNCENTDNGADMNQANVSYYFDNEYITLTRDNQTKSKDVIISLYNHRTKKYEKVASVGMEKGKYSYYYLKNGVYHFSLKPRNYNGKEKFITVSVYQICNDPNVQKSCILGGTCPQGCEDNFSGVDMEKIFNQYYIDGDNILFSWQRDMRSKYIELQKLNDQGEYEIIGYRSMIDENIIVGVPSDGDYTYKLIPRYPTGKEITLTININGICNNEDVQAKCSESSICPKSCSNTEEPVCGNSLIEEGEECDLGENNGVRGGYLCTNQCTKEYIIGSICGDGTRDNLESCDNGRYNGSGDCSLNCERITIGNCGDGNIDIGEACDNGSNNGVDGKCSYNCEKVLNNIHSCGNGFIEEGEECDNGNQNGKDGKCTTSCKKDNTTSTTGTSNNNNSSNNSNNTSNSKSKKSKSNITNIKTPFGSLLSSLIIMIINDTNNEEYHGSASTKTGNNYTGYIGDIDIESYFSRYNTGDPQSYLSNGHTIEKNNAYNFAYMIGMTTQGTIRDADLDGYLSRIAMAKMLSYYAMNVLGLKPDYSKSCTFSDLTEKIDTDFNKGGTLSCQLGIMGVNIDEFRPFEKVTRGQMVSAVSRMLYGTEDTHGSDYYSEHMRVLNEKGLITDTNPSKKEKRGNLMLILMRSVFNNI